MKLDPRLQGHVLHRGDDHRLVRGVDDRGRVWAVACTSAGAPHDGVELEVLAVGEWAPLRALLARRGPA